MSHLIWQRGGLRSLPVALASPGAVVARQNRLSTILRTRTAAVAAACAVLCIVALVPATAHAASYNGKCGSGYTVVSQRNITGGTVYLTHKGDAACAITISNTPGVRKSMSVWLRASFTTTWISDPGTYSFYAGPVYTGTFGCADYGGRIEKSQVTVYEVCW
jgi:hypothetical protein